MHKNLLYFIFLFLICIGCTKDDDPITPLGGMSESLDNYITFEFKQLDNTKVLTEDISCQVGNNLITASVPYLLTSDSLIAAFTVPSGITVSIDGVEQISGVSKNDFSKPVVYTFKNTKGIISQYSVKLATFTGLPIININTEDGQGITSKEDYINASLQVKGNAQYSQRLFSGDIQIRGRGNSSWHAMPKKSYKIKLNQKAQLLNMPADKEWILLANYSDKTLMRNYASFELSRRLGLKYTPRARFVEVFLNNKYLGNHLLTEQIKISKERLNIKELTSNDLGKDVITGGYLLEVDGRLDADSWFKTTRATPFCIKSPENIAPSQYEYIKNYVQQTEDALFSDSFADPQEGYAKFINVDSFVNWYILYELTRNNDGFFYTSVYFYKDRNGKLNIGPAWDFDIALGNIDYNGNDNPEGFYIKNSPWFKRLFQDPVFKAKVIERFNKLKATEISTINAYITQTAAYLDKSQVQNFTRWNILNKYVWPNAVVTGSYEKEVLYLSDWLEKRINWMDVELNQPL